MNSSSRSTIAAELCCFAGHLWISSADLSLVGCHGGFDPFLEGAAAYQSVFDCFLNARSLSVVYHNQSRFIEAENFFRNRPVSAVLPPEHGYSRIAQRNDSVLSYVLSPVSIVYDSVVARSGPGVAITDKSQNKPPFLPTPSRAAMPLGRSLGTPYTIYTNLNVSSHLIRFLIPPGPPDTPSFEPSSQFGHVHQPNPSFVAEGQTPETQGPHYYYPKGFMSDEIISSDFRSCHSTREFWKGQVHVTGCEFRYMSGLGTSRGGTGGPFSWRNVNSRFRQWATF
jgi:hypothetical protein